MQDDWRRLRSVTRQFVICYSEDGDGKKEAKSTRVDFSFRREKIINAFIDSIKMKDYCNASRSFSHVTKERKGEHSGWKWKIMYDDSISEIKTRDIENKSSFVREGNEQRFEKCNLLSSAETWLYYIKLIVVVESSTRSVVCWPRISKSFVKWRHHLAFIKAVYYRSTGKMR